MGNVNQMVGNYTGNDGYVTQSVNAYNSQVSDLSSQINDFNLAMIERQNALYDQYGQIQATLYSLSYDQQAWQGIYGSTNKSY
jgi:flagellar capping protein FliD